MSIEKSGSIMYLRRSNINTFGSAENPRKKGTRNERRAFLLFQELATEGIFIKVKRASKKQNRGSFDIFGIVGLVEEDQISQEVNIPFQIKSSVAQAKESEVRSANNPRKQEIMVVVVNDFRSDEDVKGYVKRAVGRFLTKAEKELPTRVQT